MSDNMILLRSAGDAFLSRNVDSTLFDHLPDLTFAEDAHGAKSSMPAVRISSGGTVRLSAICLRQIDVLSRPKDSALPSLYIGRYSPQPQSHIERIDAERGPEGKLADPMLFRMAGGAQRNGVAIARLYPYTTIGFCSHMRGV
jgi:hypothetical protein